MEITGGTCFVKAVSARGILKERAERKDWKKGLKERAERKS